MHDLTPGTAVFIGFGAAMSRPDGSGGKWNKKLTPAIVIAVSHLLIESETLSTLALVLVPNDGLWRVTAERLVRLDEFKEKGDPGRITRRLES